MNKKELRQPVFDKSTVTLMDFDVPQEKGLHFMYVLPFSKNEGPPPHSWVSGLGNCSPRVRTGPMSRDGRGLAPMK